jgi:hypothetical protein
VARLLTLLMMLVMVVANGTALEASVCRHGTSAAHAAALASHDRTVAAAALGEETAGSVADHKAALADDGSQLLAGYVLPAEPSVLPAAAAERFHPREADAAMPPGAAPPPLLQPPAH